MWRGVENYLIVKINKRFIVYFERSLSSFKGDITVSSRLYNPIRSRENKGYE